MNQRGVGLSITILFFSIASMACSTKGAHDAQCDRNEPAMAWPSHHAARASALPVSSNDSSETVTVVIALSSLIPGGIVGHSGLAVGEEYWDFGPSRVEKYQRLKSVRSPAGPWWDDPDQQWAVNRDLEAVLKDMPEQVHPLGSIIAIIQFEVTDEQADAIAGFWKDTYARMQEGEDTYALAGRQCANMVAWSLQAGMYDPYERTDRLPSDLKMMSPTKLYETLQDSLVHTAGPNAGKPAEVTLWQLDQDGFSPWYRGEIHKKLALPELPRIRLAYERFKFLPAALTH